MDFSTALECLKEGKWVRMDTWPAGEAMVLMRNEGRTWFAVVSKDGYADYYTLSTQEILSDTWMLCKTRKNSRLTLNRRSAIIMAMTQKIKQIPFTVIIPAIFVLAVLVVATIAVPVGALGTLFLITLGAAVMRIAAYIFERT